MNLYPFNCNDCSFVNDIAITNTKGIIAKKANIANKTFNKKLLFFETALNLFTSSFGSAFF